MRALILIATGLVIGLPSGSANAQWTQQGGKLVGIDTVMFGVEDYAVALSADGNTAARAGWDTSGSGVWLFTRTDTVWHRQGNKLKGTGAIGEPGQGSSVSLSADGNTLFVGGASDMGWEDILGIWESAGATWVFTRSLGVWSQQGQKLVGTHGIDAKQGFSVSISADGNTAIVGGPWWYSGGGGAWVFVLTDTGWVQQGEKLAPLGFGAGWFGWSVAISGDGNTTLVGDWGDSSDCGAAWVFVRTGNIWSQQGGKLVGTGGVWQNVGGSWYGPYQGRSVALSADGNTALVGGPTDSAGLGAAWVFTRTGSVWSQQGDKLVGTGAVNRTALQGSSVSLSADGNTALIGGAGAAWIFTRSGGAWKQVGEKLVGTSDGQPGGGGQGSHVALSADGKTAMSGAYVFVQKPLNVSDAGVSLPRMYSISQNYPNPFNPTTTIRYALPHRSRVSLIVYNTLGQQVATLVNGEVEAGYREVTFNANGLASGVYFYRLQAGDYTKTRKLCIIR
jgi:hypothetical protein